VLASRLLDSTPPLGARPAATAVGGPAATPFADGPAAIQGAPSLIRAAASRSQRRSRCPWPARSAAGGHGPEPTRSGGLNVYVVSEEVGRVVRALDSRQPLVLRRPVARP
jgi:hypothetical protein